MSKNIFRNMIVILPLFFAGISAQDQVDAIEAARQAKAAAEKAAADAEAATGAAIEAAAAKAAKEAREKIKQDKLDEEARREAEKKAAEEAELDAAANAAAEEAKRKMAEELGLEYEGPSDSEETIEESSVSGEVDSLMVSENSVEEVKSKNPLGWNIGGAASIGLLSGNSFTSIPLGATIVLTTPYGFKLGPFDYTVSFAFGGYTGSYESSEDSDYTLAEGQSHFKDEFNPTLFALGGNLTIAQFVFAEGHVGYIGSGPGLRGFTGVTLEKLMNKGLNLPFNLLVGSEIFYSTDMSGSENSSGWASLGVRIDYSF